MKSLLTGMPYVPAVETDLKKTFARIRRELKAERERDAERAKEAERVVKHITAKVKA